MYFAGNKNSESSKRMSKVSRIAISKKISASKYARLEMISSRLGKIRAAVWQEFGSIKGVGVNHRTIRDRWLKEGKAFNVPARLWKATLSDVIGDIGAYHEAAKFHVRKAVVKRTTDDAERKRMFILLKRNKWMEDSFLRRKMRKHFKHGKSRVNNQIVLDTGSYSSFINDDQAWLSVQSLDRGQRINIPLGTNVPPENTIRLILLDGKVEVHYSIDEPNCDRPCGKQVIGIDKGYTDAFTDSDGDKHGLGFGKVLSKESDYLKVKYKKRNKIRAIAKKALESGDLEKHRRIVDNNLGRSKLNNRKKCHKKTVRTIVFESAHSIVDKASQIVVEDLTKPIKSKKKISRNQKRRLAGWVKGLLAESLESVVRRRSASISLVNAAYTSQIDSKSKLLEGNRDGKLFYHANGDVSDADENAARNILARLLDDEISLYTPYTEVKKILQARADRARLGLLNQDTSLGIVPTQ